ncbi:major capsid protein [Bradyrhizobium liaoningense]|uniref:major capsid protein n=1 Tax=Bradyrhizobium liaoningense TaxID=43992 RepID=UPI001BA8CADD|nr:major capsid protein [Bradyrhizobium liaoningense]MBR0855482.1 major capsid protein [Bradyrhizobium liaoningense]
MLTMDVFNQDAFSARSLTAAIDKVGYAPSLLGTIPGLFVPVPIRTITVMIEERANAPALIQTSPRGAPPKQRGGEKRNMRGFSTVRLAEGSKIQASEIQGIRAFGSETELKQLQTEVATRQAKIRADLELTWEYHRLGALQGKVLDADGTSVIYDWATEFGQTIPAEIDFDLDNPNPATGAVRKNCNTVKRAISKGLQGLGGDGVAVGALCGDAFWDDLTSHPEVEKTFLNTQQASDLREGFGKAWTSFKYGDITWINYRGSDDGAVSVGTDKAKFFPIGAGIFQVAMSPGESFDFVNTPGQMVYSNIVVDKDRNMWAEVEAYSYPLFVCTMPQALHRAKRT